VLKYLEDEQLADLLKYKSPRIQEENFHPIANLEIYPATNHNFRLPYAADRITITDEWLNLPDEVNLKSNLVKFMGYVQDQNRQALPFTDVIQYIQKHIQHQQPTQHLATTTTKRRKRQGGGHGMGKIEPLKGRHLEFITGVVLGTEVMPEDTIGSFGAAALRHLMLVDDQSPDEALATIQEFYEAIPDVAFSDRISSGNINEILRTDAYTVAKIEEGNLYQSRPDESAAIFAGVREYCRRLGFVFADRSTWHVLRNRKKCPFDISTVDFSLTFAEKLAVKEPGAALLKCDIPSVYQAAHHVKAFVLKYPDRELSANLVPHLCAGLPISWHIPSDEGKRCKKAERFLALLCKLGIIKVYQSKAWYGDGHPRNRAARYELAKDELYHERQTEHEGERCIYITDNSPFSEQHMEEFRLDFRRLNPSLTPQYHDSG
jgi:hypothetical protein